MDNCPNEGRDENVPNICQQPHENGTVLGKAWM